MTNRSDILSAVADMLGRAESVALCGHVMPDGDCLGSMLALGLALRSMGKQVHLLSPDPVPDQYLDLLPGADEIKSELQVPDAPEIFVSVDCSVPDRLGHCKAFLDRVDAIIIIDHHAGGVNFGHLYLNDAQAPAAAEIVYDLLQILPVNIDIDMAQCLYVAINTDTGSFLYDSVTPTTHRIIARLMETGMPTGRINKKLYEEKPLVCLQVLGEVLKTLDITPCGRVASMYIERNTLNKLHARDEHVDGVTNYPRTIKGVELALFFREMEDGRFKISFRSKHFLNVNQLAARFGGGGHQRAAGCIMTGNLVDIRSRIIDAALFALKEEGK